MIQLAKMLPKSSELQTALAQDETSREFVKGMGNVLDIPSQTVWDKPLDVEHEIQPQTTTQESAGEAQEAKPEAVDPKVGTEEKPASEGQAEGKSETLLDISGLMNQAETSWPVVYCEIKSLESKVNKSKDPKKKDSPYVIYVITDGTNDMSVSMWGSAEDKNKLPLKAGDTVKLLRVTKKPGTSRDYYNVGEIEKI